MFDLIDESTSSLFNKLSLYDTFQGQAKNAAIQKKENMALKAIIKELKARIPEQGAFALLKSVLGHSAPLVPEDKIPLYSKYGLFRTTSEGTLYPLETRSRAPIFSALKHEQVQRNMGEF